MKAYIVSGTCGQYDCRQQWPVCVYLSRQAAERHAEAAQARAAQIVAEWQSKHGEDASLWYLTDAIESGEVADNEHDPGMSVDTGGTHYWVTSCKLTPDGG